MVRAPFTYLLEFISKTEVTVTLSVYYLLIFNFNFIIHHKSIIHHSCTYHQTVLRLSSFPELSRTLFPYPRRSLPKNFLHCELDSEFSTDSQLVRIPLSKHLTPFGKILLHRRTRFRSLLCRTYDTTMTLL